MVQELDKKYISQISPDFIYNRFDMFCDNYIVLIAEQGQEKHIIEACIFNKYAELGIWRMQISNALLKEISKFLFKKYHQIGYIKFFFCNTDGRYKKVTHYSIEFPDSTESLLQRRSPKSRRRLDNKRHQVEREIGEIKYQDFTKDNCPEEIVNIYNIWKEKSHHIGKIEEKELFFEKYHISNIYVLYFGKDIVAILFSCEQCPIAYLENLSYDIRYSKYSPGLQIYEYMLNRLIEKNIKVIFLGGGNYEYKQKYGSIEEILYDGVIYRNVYSKLLSIFMTYYNKHIYWKIKKCYDKINIK